MAGASSLPEFGDFDDRHVYEKFHEAALGKNTGNFVIEFDSTKAFAACNLDNISMIQLLQLEVNDLACYMLEIKCVHCCSKTEG